MRTPVIIVNPSTNLGGPFGFSLHSVPSLVANGSSEGVFEPVQLRTGGGSKVGRRGRLSGWGEVGGWRVERQSQLRPFVYKEIGGPINSFRQRFSV